MVYDAFTQTSVDMAYIVEIGGCGDGTDAPTQGGVMSFTKERRSEEELRRWRIISHSFFKVFFCKFLEFGKNVVDIVAVLLLLSFGTTWGWVDKKVIEEGINKSHYNLLTIIAIISDLLKEMKR